MQHKKPPKHIGGCPTYLERTNNFMARSCYGETSGGRYFLSYYWTEKEAGDPEAFQMQQIMFT